jgi:hypothetical protein
MTQTINIESIVTMMRMLPKQYDTEAIKVAKGKYKLPTTIGTLIKKLKNG